MAALLKPQNANVVKVHLSASTEKDAAKITGIINEESKRSGAVLHVFEDEVKGWIKEGLSFVAKTDSGEIVGHHAASVWSGSGWVELRAAVVIPEYRGNGINKHLKEAIMDAITEKYPNATIVSVKNKSSNGRQVLGELGFKQIDPSEAPNELFGIGPEGEAYDIYVYTPSKDIVKQLVRA
jgi:N-acetylglutamate synthase-like GNAT family acetyltransferase